MWSIYFNNSSYLEADGKDKTNLVTKVNQGFVNFPTIKVIKRYVTLGQENNSSKNFRTLIYGVTDGSVEICGAFDTF